MNVYNLSNLNKAELTKMVEAKQAIKKAFTVQAFDIDNKLSDLHITNDLQASLFTQLKLKLDGLKVSIKNVDNFLDIASSVNNTIKPSVSLSKKSFVSLSKPTLSRVSLSKPDLCRVTMNSSRLIKTA